MLTQLQIVVLSAICGIMEEEEHPLHRKNDWLLD